MLEHVWVSFSSFHQLCAAPQRVSHKLLTEHLVRWSGSTYPRQLRWSQPVKWFDKRCNAQVERKRLGQKTERLPAAQTLAHSVADFMEMSNVAAAGTICLAADTSISSCFHNRCSVCIARNNCRWALASGICYGMTSPAPASLAKVWPRMMPEKTPNGISVTF